MELAELEVKVDDIFQSIRLSFGKEVLCSFMQSLSQRHLGIDYQFGAERNEDPDYFAMIHPDDMADVALFYQNHDINIHVPPYSYTEPDNVVGVGAFDAREAVCKECGNSISLSPLDQTTTRKRKGSAMHAPIEKGTRAISNQTQATSYSVQLPGTSRQQFQNLYRESIISFLGTHWKFLTTNGLFATSAEESIQLPKDTTHLIYKQQRGYHDILRALEKRDSLHSLRRAVAEIRSLQCYSDFLEEVQLRPSRKRGESAKNLAHREYISQMFPGATPESLKIHHANFKSDLQSARRWMLMTEGYEGKGGAGLGIILAASEIFIALINNKSKVTHKILLQYLDIFTNDPLAINICQTLRPVAEALLQYHKLTDELDWQMVSSSLESQMWGRK